MPEEVQAATPAENLNGGTPPATPAATPAPATPDGTLPAVPDEGLVLTFKTKEEKEQYERDVARARSNQSKADRYDRLIGQGKLGSHFKPSTPATPPSEEEKEEAADIEDRKAEKGLMGLAIDPAYREVLDADPTLRNLLTKSPLSILPIYAPDALDAEDAISLVKEKLAIKADELKAKGQAPTAPLPSTPPATPAALPATPPAGGVNPSGVTTPDAEYETARKLPNTESAIAGMVKQGLKKLGGK